MVSPPHKNDPFQHVAMDRTVRRRKNGRTRAGSFTWWTRPTTMRHDTTSQPLPPRTHPRRSRHILRHFHLHPSCTPHGVYRVALTGRITLGDTRLRRHLLEDSTTSHPFSEYRPHSQKNEEQHTSPGPTTTAPQETRTTKDSPTMPSSVPR